MVPMHPNDISVHLKIVDEFAEYSVPSRISHQPFAHQSMMHSLDFLTHLGISVEIEKHCFK